MWFVDSVDEVPRKYEYWNKSIAYFLWRGLGYQYLLMYIYFLTVNFESGLTRLEEVSEIYTGIPQY